MKRWSVRSFLEIDWRWGKELIKPIGVALERRLEAVNRSEHDFSSLNIVTLHFNGEMEPRDLKGKTDFKGKLYFGHPGDVIYSKIDLRNGAIGIIPEDYEYVTMSSEYPIYKIRQEYALSQYIQLLLRTSFFRDTINSMISGAGGRKRVNPEELESVPVPMLPLSKQHEIVSYWNKLKERIDEKRGEIEVCTEKLGRNLLQKIGLTLRPSVERKGAFSLRWDKIERWDTYFYRDDFVHVEEQLTKYGARQLKELVHFISRPWSKDDFPSGSFKYIEIACVTKEGGIIDSSLVDVGKAPSRATTLIKEGDIIVATTRPYLGAFTIVPKKYDGCVCTSGFAVVREREGAQINKRFLLHFLKSAVGLRQMERRMTGGLYPAITQPELEKVLVPVPPLKVQEEFVNDAEKTLAQISQGREEIASMQMEAQEKIERMIQGLD